MSPKSGPRSFPSIESLEERDVPAVGATGLLASAAEIRTATDSIFSHGKIDQTWIHSGHNSLRAETHADLLSAIASAKYAPPEAPVDHSVTDAAMLQPLPQTRPEQVAAAGLAASYVMSGTARETRPVAKEPVAATDVPRTAAKHPPLYRRILNWFSGT